MGFFKKLFGQNNTQPITTTPDPKEEQQKTTDEENNEALRLEHEFQTLCNDGLRSLNMGETDFATRCFQAALERKDDDEVKGHLAETYIRSRQGEKAIPILQELIATHPDEINLHMAMVHAARNAEDWDTLNAAAKEVTRLRPDLPNGTFYQAEAKYSKGNFDQAETLLTTLLSEHQDAAQAVYLRAKVRYDNNQLNEALEDIQHFIRMAEPTEEANILNGDIHAKLGQKEEAIACYQQALDTNPFHQEAVIKIGTLYHSMQEWEKALHVYSEAIELQSDFAQAYKERSAVRQQLQDEAGASADLLKSLELSPEEDEVKDYATLENRMNARYRNQNPFGF